MVAMGRWRSGWRSAWRWESDSRWGGIATGCDRARSWNPNARFQRRIRRDWLPATTGPKGRTNGARPRFGLVFMHVQGSFCSLAGVSAERFRLGCAGRLLPECRPCCSFKLKLTGMPLHTDLLGRICCWKPRRRTGLQQQCSSSQRRLQPTRRSTPPQILSVLFWKE